MSTIIFQLKSYFLAQIIRFLLLNPCKYAKNFLTNEIMGKIQKVRNKRRKIEEEKSNV
tara:strand:+ start:421 stop:594 length:174 start_codon:yes stop_codon:yes gene_type:complete